MQLNREAPDLTYDRDHPRDHVRNGSDPGHAHEEGEREELGTGGAHPNVGDGQEEQEVEREEADPPDVGYVRNEAN